MLYFKGNKRTRLLNIIVEGREYVQVIDNRDDLFDKDWLTPFVATTLQSHFGDYAYMNLSVEEKELAYQPSIRCWDGWVVYETSLGNDPVKAVAISAILHLED
jgi:hypothetical protein